MAAAARLSSSCRDNLLCSKDCRGDTIEDWRGDAIEDWRGDTIARGPVGCIAASTLDPTHSPEG